MQFLEEVVRRKVDGAIVNCRTDSHDPRIYKRPAQRAGLLSWQFSFDRPPPFSFAKTKENGGGFRGDAAAYPAFRETGQLLK